MQYHAALTDKGLPATVGGWNGKNKKKQRKILIYIFFCFFLLAAAKSEPLRILPPEPDNTTDVEDCIKKAKANEKDFNRININNIKEVKADVLKELLNSLKDNTTVQSLEMANVGMTDSVGRVCLLNQQNTKKNQIFFLYSLGTCRTS